MVDEMEQGKRIFMDRLVKDIIDCFHVFDLHDAERLHTAIEEGRDIEDES